MKLYNNGFSWSKLVETIEVLKMEKLIQDKENEKLTDEDLDKVNGGEANEPELSEDDIKVVGQGFKPNIFINH